MLEARDSLRPAMSLAVLERASDLAGFVVDGEDASFAAVWVAVRALALVAASCAPAVSIDLWLGSESVAPGVGSLSADDDDHSGADTGDASPPVRLVFRTVLQGSHTSASADLVASAALHSAGFRAVEADGRCVCPAPVLCAFSRAGCVALLWNLPAATEGSHSAALLQQLAVVLAAYPTSTLFCYLFFSGWQCRALPLSGPAARVGLVHLCARCASWPGPPSTHAVLLGDVVQLLLPRDCLAAAPASELGEVYVHLRARVGVAHDG